MASHKISIENGAAFECSDDVYILDAVDDAGIDRHDSCRAGACSTCVSYPTADCVIRANAEEKHD